MKGASTILGVRYDEIMVDFERLYKQTKVDQIFEDGDSNHTPSFLVKPSLNITLVSMSKGCWLQHNYLTPWVN